MPNTIRPRRDFEALTRRRKRAARFFANGNEQATVARILKVSRQSVSRWYRQWSEGGASSLRGADRAGRLPNLDTNQIKQLDRALRRGAHAHKFNTDLWTLPRVAKVIERTTGVHYHPGHVWRILRSMNWSLQRPAKRARERNEELVQQWVADKWPAVKKKPDAKEPGSSSKTRAGSRSDRQCVAHGRQKEKRRS